MEWCLVLGLPAYSGASRKMAASACRSPARRGVPKGPANYHEIAEEGVGAEGARREHAPVVGARNGVEQVSEGEDLKITMRRCLPPLPDPARARAAPLRPRAIGLRGYLSICRARRCIHTLPNNGRLWPTHQNFLRRPRSEQRARACSRNRNRPDVEHEQARFAENRRL
jgi:hypothetical protein